ncbi:hypothetical protein NAPIS_ORF00351 [Vairimorpha apis BRL 01]|uniref:Uncharacterized protein n=1 Tax=Vairimorpha apis BRL 01 TaxID=1037528 RepID=T0LCN0_9MICR|nr:hypothetical protein NAPIS_ORF00351 [Vairimorpha apis BRL 01]
MIDFINFLIYLINQIHDVRSKVCMFQVFMMIVPMCNSFYKRSVVIKFIVFLKLFGVMPEFMSGGVDGDGIYSGGVGCGDGIYSGGNSGGNGCVDGVESGDGIYSGGDSRCVDGVKKDSVESSGINKNGINNDKNNLNKNSININTNDINDTNNINVDSNNINNSDINDTNNININNTNNNQYTNNNKYTNNNNNSNINTTLILTNHYETIKIIYLSIFILSPPNSTFKTQSREFVTYIKILVNDTKCLQPKHGCIDKILVIYSFLCTFLFQYNEYNIVDVWVNLCWDSFFNGGLLYYLCC